MTVLELMVELSKYPFSAEVSIDEGRTLVAAAKKAQAEYQNAWPNDMRLVIGRRPAHAAPISATRVSYVGVTGV